MIVTDISAARRVSIITSKRGKTKRSFATERICESCGDYIKRNGHECNRRYCATCKQNTETGHLRFIKPLQNESVSTEKVLYVFYDFETTQDNKYSEKATVHVPNLVCLQQFCLKCESINIVEQDCSQCGRRIHSFWQDSVWDLESYLCEQPPWANKVIAIAHNAKSFDLHLILNRAILLKWQPQILINGMKIMCMKFEHMVFLDSLCFLPLPLPKLPVTFGLTSSKSWYLIISIQMEI
jgi:hypothetical protein